MSNNIPIREYVNSLEYGQLCNLIEHATAKRNEKDNENKVWVHQVTSYLLCENFRSEDIQGAAKHIAESVLKIAESDDELSEKVYKIKQVGLNSFKERESEYESWFD